MPLPLPEVVQIKNIEGNNISSGLYHFDAPFDEAPGFNEIVVLVIGVKIQSLSDPPGPQNIVIAPGEGVVPNETELWEAVLSILPDSALEPYEVYVARGDGVKKGWAVQISWDNAPTQTIDFIASFIHLKNIDPDDPVASTLTDTNSNSEINSISVGGITLDQSLILKGIQIHDDDSTGIEESPASLGSSVGTVQVNPGDFSVDLTQGINSSILSSGTSGNYVWSWDGANPNGAFSLELKNGTVPAAPPYDEAAFTFGWNHSPAFENLSWSDEGRVLTWGNVRRKTSSALRGFSNGIDALEIADTDQVLWGSTFGANGTSMLWRNIQINSRFHNDLYGFVQGTVPLAVGRVVEFNYSENKVRLGLYDGMDDISNAQFIWDYLPLYATSGTNFYGTVIAVYGSNVIVEESPEHDLRKSMNTIENQNIDKRTFNEKWARLGNLGIIGTDGLLPGDKLKFHSSALAATDAGSVLLPEIEYTVQSGSFFISQTSAAAGTYGTIELQAPPTGINPGDFVYKRLPLWYRGNPAEIVRQFLIGSNTSLRLDSSIINATYYSAATEACAQMNFQSLMTIEGQGGIISELKKISEAVDAVFFFDRVGSFCWIPFRPRTRDDADFVSNYYDGTILGGTAGTGNMWGANWSQDISGVLTDITFNYNFNHLEDESNITYRGQVRRSNLDTATWHRGYRNAATLNTQWVKDEDDAVILAERKLRMATVSRPHYEFQTSLFGIEQDLYQLLRLTHRTGSMVEQAFQVDEIDFDIDGDLIAARLNDVTDVYFGRGYGYWEDGPLASHAVSGTSRAGWGWLTGSHGTTGTGILLGSLGELVELWGTSGVRPDIGSEGYTQWITVGSEILLISGTTGDNATFVVAERAADVSDSGTHPLQSPWTAYPQDANGDLLALYNGTEFRGIHTVNLFGTVHNINTATFGTVFRLW